MQGLLSYKVNTMNYIITGATHTGKTALSQKMLEKYKIPYYSMDHIKMGLIRAGLTELTPDEDSRLTDYLWPITAEIIKTAVENRQNLIVEGCYVPFNWKSSFDAEYLDKIKYCCLVMSERYIRTSFDSIINHRNTIEQRLFDENISPEILIAENRRYLEGCLKAGLPYHLIDSDYSVNTDIFE